MSESPAESPDSTMSPDSSIDATEYVEDEDLYGGRGAISSGGGGGGGGGPYIPPAVPGPAAATTATTQGSPTRPTRGPKTTQSTLPAPIPPTAAPGPRPTKSQPPTASEPPMASQSLATRKPPMTTAMTAATKESRTTLTITTTAPQTNVVDEIICTVGSTAVFGQMVPPDGLCNYIYYTNVVPIKGDLFAVEINRSWEVFKETLATYQTTSGGIGFDVRLVM
ncbi:uncharacterized protein LOC142774250 [Rhipicephalus microplus]|uniref:uncharacterized protein LOC142774250 n=1 Tax=Rhipicephalus microplus TaxID=6941 RepID=UPI003F6B0603